VAAAAVGVLQPQADLGEDRLRLLEIEEAVPSPAQRDDLVQAHPAFQQLHRVERPPVHDPLVVDAHDVLLGEALDLADLPAEVLPAALLGEEGRREELQRDLAVDLAVLDAVDGAEGRPADPVEDQVAGLQLRPGLQPRAVIRGGLGLDGPPLAIEHLEAPLERGQVDPRLGELLAAVRTGRGAIGSLGAAAEAEQQIPPRMGELRAEPAPRPGTRGLRSITRLPPF